MDFALRLGMSRSPPLLLLFLCGLLAIRGVHGVTFGEVFGEPMQNVTVYQNETAIFTCEVRWTPERTSGSTGWRHHENMQFLGNKPFSAAASTGKYYTDFTNDIGTQQLKIFHVTDADNGPVECVTMPGGADIPDAGFLKNRAYLNVLVPPSEVIIDAGVATSMARVYRMDETVNLTCVAKGGRPHPKLIWFRGSRRVDSDEDNTISEWHAGNLTYSSLTFRAAPDDDQGDVTCQAESPALRTPLTFGTRVAVQYPPQTPIIKESEGLMKKSVRAGVSLSLTCISERGNPRPKLTWFKNGVQEEASDNAPAKPPSSTLMFVPRAADNGAVLKCEATNALMPAGVAVQTVLDVQFGPVTATIDGPTEVRPQPGVEFHCASAASNPTSKIIWSINGKPYGEVRGREQPTEHGGFITTSTVRLNLTDNDSTDIEVRCEAVNPGTNSVTRSAQVVRVLPKAGGGEPSRAPKGPIGVEIDGKEAQPSNETTYYTAEPSATTAVDNLSTVVAVSASVGGIVFMALVGCLVFVCIRGRNKKFEEMANSDSSGSSKGHTEVCSQNCMDIGTDTTGSDVEKSHDIYSQITPKKVISPSVVRTNAASTYLLDENYTRSPYGTYRHWVAPEPVGHDSEHEMGVDYESENDYIEALRRSAMHSLMPHNHSPSPLRPIPNHITYEPIPKSALLSTFHGQQLYPNYRAETSVDELKGHLV